MNTTIGHSKLSAPGSKKGCAPRRKKGQLSGFTIAEVVIALSLTVMAMTVALGAVIELEKRSMALLNYAIMSDQGQKALEILGRDARMCKYVTLASEQEFVMQRLNLSGGLIDVSYIYNADTSTLERTEAGLTEDFLKNVSDITFNYYNIRGEATVTGLEVKSVQIDTIMRRMVLSAANTDHIVSAQFMMRNRDVSN